MSNKIFFTDEQYNILIEWYMLKSEQGIDTTRSQDIIEKLYMYSSRNAEGEIRSNLFHTELGYIIRDFIDNIHITPREDYTKKIDEKYEAYLLRKEERMKAIHDEAIFALKHCPTFTKQQLIDFISGDIMVYGFQPPRSHEINITELKREAKNT